MRYLHAQGDKTEGDDENADRGMSTNKLTFPSLLDKNPKGLRQAGGWRYHLNEKTHMEGRATTSVCPGCSTVPGS